MNRYIVTHSQLDGYSRRSAHIPERANTARLIILPAHLILINTAAAPGCNVDRIFYTVGAYADFVGDCAFILLRE